MQGLRFCCEQVMLIFSCLSVAPGSLHFRGARIRLLHKVCNYLESPVDHEPLRSKRQLNIEGLHKRAECPVVWPCLHDARRTCKLVGKYVSHTGFHAQEAQIIFVPAKSLSLLKSSFFSYTALNHAPHASIRGSWRHIQLWSR